MSPHSMVFFVLSRDQKYYVASRPMAKRMARGQLIRFHLHSSTSIDNDSPAIGTRAATV